MEHSLLPQTVGAQLESTQSLYPAAEGASRSSANNPWVSAVQPELVLVTFSSSYNTDP